jgi:hypothetical protein
LENYCHPQENKIFQPMKVDTFTFIYLCLLEFLSKMISNFHCISPSPLFDAILGRITFLISFRDCSVLVNRNAFAGWWSGSNSKSTCMKPWVQIPVWKKCIWFLSVVCCVLLLCWICLLVLIVLLWTLKNFLHIR